MVYIHCTHILCILSFNVKRNEKFAGWFKNVIWGLGITYVRVHTGVIRSIKGVAIENACHLFNKSNHKMMIALNLCFRSLSARFSGKKDDLMIFRLGKGSRKKKTILGARPLRGGGVKP